MIIILSNVYSNILRIIWLSIKDYKEISHMAKFKTSIDQITAELHWIPEAIVFENLIFFFVQAYSFKFTEYFHARGRVYGIRH